MAKTLHSTEQCIRKCLDCYQVCTNYAMNFCLEHGGRHVEPGHYRLMINCADICSTAAKFMLSGSDLHAKVCAVCADVCEACAQSCEDVGQMDECVKTCRDCAVVCLQMAAAAADKQLPRGEERRFAAPM